MLLAPITAIACFYGLHLYSAVKLDKPSLDHNSPQRSRNVAASVAAIVICYVLSFMSCVYNTSEEPKHVPEPAEVITHIINILFFGRQFLTFAKDEDVVWRQYVWTWVCALMFHLIELFIEPRRSTKLQTATIGLLFISISLAWRYQNAQISTIDSQKYREKREMRRKQNEKLDEDADFDSEASEQERVEEHREERKKRLREAGSWLEYLKAYKIFIPMIFPVSNIKLQLCMVVLIFEIIITRTLGLLGPRYMGIITDKLAAGSIKGNFPWLDIAIWGLLTLCESEISLNFRSMLFMPLEQYAMKELSMASFKHVMDLSMDFHHDKSSSDLIRVVEQGQSITELLSFACYDLVPLIVDMAIALIYISTTFDAYMAFIVISGSVGYLWIRSQRTKWQVKTRKTYNQLMRDSSKLQYEALSNWSTVSQFNRSKYETDRYSDGLDQYIKAWTTMNTSENLVDIPMLTISRIVATTLAMYRVSQGSIPLGELITFVAVYNTVTSPITSLSWMMRRIQTLFTDSERLLQLLQTKQTVISPPQAKKLQLKRGKIEFNHVNFAYDPRKPTLSDISFVAKPGTTVALVGETGGGKSTIMKMLYRYYDVSSGSIKIDGQDIREVQLDSLRDSFGFVPQNASLFNLTLAENLRYARLDATDEDIEDACKAACIHDKIMQFPDKYESKVGERGIKLSGGEMQRIAIARAILRDPKIVLLDEATSQIDALTEAQIQTALRHLTAGRTTFVVAHRLSTIQHADLIIVIENGRMIEQGSHEELWKLDGRYVALWSKQLNKGQLLDPAAKASVLTPIASSDDDDDDDDDADTESDAE